MKKLIEIQRKLKAPKGQTNTFGKYKYRSCEDILEAVKPLCVEAGLLLTLTDDMVLVGDRVYVKATASVREGSVMQIQVTAYARESESKKGMDASQITGAASSYARKYALNGLFLIDDTKDADTQDNSKVEIEYIDETEKSSILDYLDDTSIGIDKAVFLKFFKVDSVEKLPKKLYNQVIIALDTRKNTGKEKVC